MSWARISAREGRTLSEGPRYGHADGLELLGFVPARMHDDRALNSVGLCDVVEQASAPAVAGRGEISCPRRSGYNPKSLTQLTRRLYTRTLRKSVR